MGQYFKFVNLVTEEISEAPVSQNFGLSWHCKLLEHSAGEIVESFQEAAAANGWDIAEVVAVGDYGTIVLLDEDNPVDSDINDWDCFGCWNFLQSIYCDD